MSTPLRSTAIYGDAPDDDWDDEEEPDDGTWEINWESDRDEMWDE